MKAQHVLPAIATLILFACNSAPKAEENMATPATTTVAPVDTVNNRYERKEMKQIGRDTIPSSDTSLMKVP